MMIRLFLIIILNLSLLFALPPQEFQTEPYSFVPFYSGEYQDFAGASSFFGFYATKNLRTSKETPNLIAIGVKAGSVDETLDKTAWFIKKDIALSNMFYASLKYNHTMYKTYQVGENTYSGMLGFEGFFNNTNLFYASFGMFYRTSVTGSKYRIPFAIGDEYTETFLLASMGYKHFAEADHAFSFDINNYNDFHVYNFNNLGFDINFSSYLSDSVFYLVDLELRFSGMLVGTAMLNEERFLLGLGFNF